MLRLRPSLPPLLAVSLPARLLLAALLTALILPVSISGCGQQTAAKSAAELGSRAVRSYGTADVAAGVATSLPAWVAAAERDAYQFALAFPDLLAYIPCYCGCALTSKHRNSLECFIQGVDQSGSVVFDDHAAKGCSVCLDIVSDVQRLNNEGRSLGEIRSYIDERYSQIGPGTDTPPPPL